MVDSRRHAGTMGLSRRVIARANDNGGYLTREQMRMIGLSDSAIDRLIRDGEITPVAAGVFQIIPSDDHKSLIHGALLALPEAVASHQTAAHLLRFPELPELVPTVTVASATTHRFPGVTVRRADDLRPGHLITVEGIRCTNSARTVFDLAGILRYRVFLPVAEAAVTSGRVSHTHLEALAGELSRRGKRGSKAMADFIGWTSRSSGTALERRGRSILANASLPPPVPEYPIPWDPGRRFDDAYPDHRFAIEWDSRRWHERRAAMQADRDRDRAAILHGWVVVRFTWDDVTRDSEKIASSVAQILADRAPIARTLGSQRR